MMRKSLFVLGTCFCLLSSVAAKSQPVVASASCFHGWVSERNANDEPTGFCRESKETEYLNTSVEADFPTQRLYIHGNIAGVASTWFRYEVTSCEDTKDGWTVVNGVNPSTGEKYTLRQREIKEVPPTGQAKRAFAGEAKLSVDLNGAHYESNLSCLRYVF